MGKLETLLKEDPLFLDKLKQKVADGEFSSKDDTKNMTIQIDMFATICDLNMILSYCIEN